jgi:hypothetical protein
VFAITYNAQGLSKFDVTADEQSRLLHEVVFIIPEVGHALVHESLHDLRVIQ